MISNTFQILKVTTYNNVPVSFPEHVCYYTQDTGKYYIYKNGVHQEVFGGIVQSITHAELVDLKTTGSLLPGAKYLITDFQTIYDQPDFDSAGNPKSPVNIVVKTSNIERIVVQAIDESTLLTRAESLDFPEDTIDYILEFTTPVTGTATKGKIIKRIDARGNETDFDHRTVLFKRYEDITYGYGDFFECFDNGGSYQEFLAIQQDQYTYNNRIGATSSQYPFDLPNFVLGIFGPGDDFYDNEFSSAPINTTFVGYAINNKIDSLVNCTFLYCNTNVINTATNCRFLCSSFGANNIKNATSVIIKGDGLVGNTIGYLSNVSLTGTGTKITESNIVTLSYITSTKTFELLQCNFNTFSNNFIEDQIMFQYSNINVFTNNHFKPATLKNMLHFTSCDFEYITGCTFYGDFGLNRGRRISQSIFRGHAINNVFTDVYNCRFGNNFGDLNSNTQFDGYPGNQILSYITGCTFGSNCLGNIISAPLEDFISGDYLMNNEIQDSPLIGTSVTSGPLFERQFSKVFIAPSIDNTVYSLGDYLGPQPEYYFYRSEIINTIPYNFFMKYLPYTTAIWQNPITLSPLTFTHLWTIDGLNSSAENTAKLRADLETEFAGQVSLGLLLNTELEYDPLGLIGYYPTLAELQVIYTNITAIGITITGKVWSSTESGTNTAYALDFDTGLTSSESKDTELGVIYIYEKRYDYGLKVQYINTNGSQVIEDLY